VLRRAVELGVNHIDTAAFYVTPGGIIKDGDGPARYATELIREALAPYPEDLVIATKVGPGIEAGRFQQATTAAELRRQVEENLRRLGRDQLDVVNLRIIRSLGRDSVADRFGALAELRDAGLIRHLGLSNVRLDHLDEATAIAPVVCVQNSYGGLLDTGLLPGPGRAAAVRRELPAEAGLRDGGPRAGVRRLSRRPVPGDRAPTCRRRRRRCAG
jgi:pyridoxine 4-dehydrogenase